MRKLILIALLLTNIAFAQDCNSPNLLPVISGGAAFTNGAMSPNIKFGFWHNVAPSGPTLFAGYQDQTPIRNKPTAKNGYNDSIRYAGLYFIEVGYKTRINERLLFHTYGGVNGLKGYAGADLFYQLGETALIGLDYRMKALGFSIIVRLK